MYVPSHRALGFTASQEKELLETTSATHKEIERQARYRKIATIAAVAGAVFAAGRLGILAVPFVREKRWRKAS